MGSEVLQAQFLHDSEMGVFDSREDLGNVVEKRLGIGKLFPPGSSIEASKSYIETWVKENRR